MTVAGTRPVLVGLVHEATRRPCRSRRTGREQERGDFTTPARSQLSYDGAGRITARADPTHARTHDERDTMTDDAAPDAGTVPHDLRVVVMGVSGAGKSTVGALLAERLGLPFIDGDDLHPPANVAKMASGTPLVDGDRWSWLDAVAEVLARPGGVVVAASVLKRSYRDRVRAGAPDTRFVELRGTEEVLRSRLGQRLDHFMPPVLLASQLEAWEPLDDDEAGSAYDIELEPVEIAEAAASDLTRSA